MQVTGHAGTGSEQDPRLHHPGGGSGGTSPSFRMFPPPMKVSAPRHYCRPGVGSEWVLRKPGSRQARNPPCPPSSVADVSSAPLDAEAGSGPAPRPGSGCAVGNERRRKEAGRCGMELEGYGLHRPPQSWKLSHDRRLERGPPRRGWEWVSVMW